MKRILSVLTIASVAVLASGFPSSAEDYKKEGDKQGWFEKADTDGNGKVSKAEYSALKKSKGMEDEAKITKSFDKKDTNSDGVLTEQEFDSGKKGEKKE